MKEDQLNPFEHIGRAAFRALHHIAAKRLAGRKAAEHSTSATALLDTGEKNEWHKPNNDGHHYIQPIEERHVAHLLILTIKPKPSPHSGGERLTSLPTEPQKLRQSGRQPDAEKEHEHQRAPEKTPESSRSDDKDKTASEGRKSRSGLPAE